MKNIGTTIIKTLILVCVLQSHGVSQNTIGLITHTEESIAGYTLFAPFQNTQTYLIDNCGHKIMEWSSDVQAGMAAYIMPDGNLVRAGALPNDQFLISGKGGLIEIKDWDDEIVWSYTLSDSMHCMHHDLEILPNGNILAIASEYKTEAEVLQAGRPTAEGEVYNEKIIEIEPNLATGGATIVWQWSVWDHLIQDVDSTAANYGEVESNAGRIDINYYNAAQIQRNWIHANSLDYNPILDQIIITSRQFEELWVVDHSTTNEEAATNAGGQYGKGGEILYRWGNPLAYKNGDAQDKRLGKPHDAQWITTADEQHNQIMVFNNEYQNGSNSAVHIIEVPVADDGSYPNELLPYGPVDYGYTYTEDDLYSSFASGAEILDDGHLLICDADSGRFFEVNNQDEIVWEYINPVTLNGIVDQGTDASNVSNNAVFKIERYSAAYDGLQNKDLTPQGPIESLSDYDCTILSDIAETTLPPVDIIIYPNPVSDLLSISSSGKVESYSIFNMQGKKMAYTKGVDTWDISLDVDPFPQGSYIIQLTLDTGMVHRQVLIIQK